jgi:hypothetical protein
LRRCIA